MRDLNKDIGKRVKEVRDSLDLTQPQLGKKLGVGKTTVSKYENGETERGIPTETLIKIAELGNVTLDYLITGKDPPQARADLTPREALKLVITSDPDLLKGVQEEFCEYHSPAPKLTAEERRLVENYREASDEMKETAIVMLERSARKSREKEGGGDVSQQEKSA